MKLKPIEELTFTDDFLFGRVMQNAEICKGFLERMLEIKIEKIEYPELQKSISPHYQSKGIRLDVYVQDSNRVFDIEIQNSLDENLPKRTRYYQSMMDVDLLLKGNNYTELKESFVIFICKDDFFGFNLPCYSIKYCSHGWRYSRWRCFATAKLVFENETGMLSFQKKCRKKINSRVY